MNSSHRSGWLVDFVLLAAIWGSSFMFMRLGTREFGPIPTAGLRVAVGALFLTPLLLARRQGPTLTRHWRLTFAVGILNSAIPFACFSFALLYISTGLSAILNATVPLFGTLVAWLWLKDRPDASRLTGLAVGFGGVSLLAMEKIGFHGPGALANAAGVLACLLASLCYGIAASIAKKYMGGLPPLVSAGGSQIGATLFLLPLTLLLWPATPPSPHAWMAVATLGVVCTGLAYVLYFRLIERAGPARALSVTFAIPAFAVFYGVVLLGESLTLWMVACAAVIVAGVTLSTGLLRLPTRR